MTAFREASDRALYVDVGESIGAASQARVARLLRWLEAHPLAGLVNVHPAYTSVLVVFDPLATTPDEIQRELTAPLEHLDTLPLDHPRTVEIPVRYGGIDGPDLGDVAAYHGISAQRVVDLHSAAWYTVDFLGFVPGFAYLGGLPAELATPRLETPRTHVPAGSVGIAGAQTGVYPFITPGGWRIIGRTDERLFDAEREPASLLQTGDRVRFVAA